jgi:hypothetical protein
MTVLPKHFFEELGPDGLLFGLALPSLDELTAAKREFPNVSEKYWEFVSKIGVGEAKNSGASACLPFRMNDLDFPSGFVTVHFPQASWLYCLKDDGSDPVYVYDYVTQEMEYDEVDFFAFIQRSIEFAKTSATVDEVEKLERELLSSETRANPQRVAEVLDDGFLEIGSSGQYWNKASVVTFLKDEAPFEFEMSLIQSRLLNSSTVLLFYDLTVTTPTGETHKSLRTSLWRRTDQWRMLWHQGTVAASHRTRVKKNA